MTKVAEKWREILVQIEPTRLKFNTTKINNVDFLPHLNFFMREKYDLPHKYNYFRNC